MKIEPTLAFYVLSSSIFLLSVLGGILLSVQASRVLNEYQYTGTLVNIKCDYDWINGQYENFIYLTISYFVKNEKYIKTYDTPYYQGCDISSWTIAPASCCKDLIGDKVWIKVANNNVSSVVEISPVSGSGAGTQIFFAIIFFFFMGGMGALLAKTGYTHYKTGEFSFPMQTKFAPLLEKAQDL